MASSNRIKRSDVQKKFYELKDKLKVTIILIEKLDKGLVEQNRIKSEYEGAIITLHEILTVKKET